MAGTGLSFTSTSGAGARAAGVTVRSQFWQVWTIRDGKVVQATHHSEKAEALEVGLSE